MNDDALRDLLTAIREQCPTSVWSEAVELARSRAVVGESVEGDEVNLRVTTDAGLRCPKVTLWLEEGDFFCDCDDGSDGVCVHAAAAVIALRQARKSGKPLPEASQPTGKLGYRLRRGPGGILFERVVVMADREESLRSTLSAVALGRVAGPRFVADSSDLQVERALNSRLGGLFARHELEPLLDALRECSDVRLDGKPVKIAPPESPVHVVVEDCAVGFRLTAIQDPRITEVFDNGVVLCGDVLRPLGEPGLTVRELEDLRKGTIIPTQEVARLLTDLLPSLKSRVTVHVRSKQLPTMDAHALPRIAIESTRDGHELVVLATIVYGEPPIARVDGDRLTHLRGPLPVRRPDMERRLARTLESDYGLAPGIRVRMPFERGMDMAERLGRPNKEVSVVGDGHASFFRAGDLSADLHVRGDDFDVTFRTKDGGSADASVVLRAWNTGASMVPLLEGGWASLPEGFLDRHGTLLSDLLAARAATESKRLPASAVIDLAKLCEALEVDGPPSFEGLRPLVENFDGIPEAPLPSDLQADLRPYQRVGVNWLSFLRSAGLGALLADDMGLGKTLQALCAMQGRTLVVAPTSVVHNWVAEIRRFRPGLSFNLYHGPKRSLDADADVTLTTYALLRIDADKLTGVEWDTLVLDEAQSIKNPDSQVAQAAYGLRAAFRVAMTGTPVENRLDELWSQFHAIHRGLLGSREDFRDRIVRPILDGDKGATARLRERIRPFVLRRRKAEVAPELPPRTDIVLRCELGETERALYESIRGATVPSVVEKLREGGNVMAALEALLRLRQAACHPGLLPGQEADSSAKVELLLEMLEHAREDGHKALVFSQWTSLLDRMEPHLERLSLPFVRLDGSTRDRESVVRTFQSEEGPPVMLVSLKAGGTGLNLTAADHVFLLDPWWNPAVEDQAADRTHRIGQERPVMVYKLVAKDTVEERILELQEHKRALAGAALDGGEAAAGLTRDDLLALLA
jgi:superfamily II DNA or RNA helicase